MDLTLERPGDHLFVRSVSAAGVQVVDRVFEGAIVLGARELHEPWAVSGPDALTEESLAPVFAMEPEVVLLGTGARQVFPAPELMMCFYRRGVGVEVMTTDAACRTFNILVGEGRRVVAALLPPALGQSMNGNSR